MVTLVGKERGACNKAGGSPAGKDGALRGKGKITTTVTYKVKVLPKQAMLVWIHLEASGSKQSLSDRIWYHYYPCCTSSWENRGYSSDIEGQQTSISIGMHCPLSPGNIRQDGGQPQGDVPRISPLFR